VYVFLDACIIFSLHHHNRTIRPDVTVTRYLLFKDARSQVSFQAGSPESSSSLVRTSAGAGPTMPGNLSNWKAQGRSHCWPVENGCSRNVMVMVTENLLLEDTRVTEKRPCPQGVPISTQCTGWTVASTCLELHEVLPTPLTPRHGVLLGLLSSCKCHARQLQCQGSFMCISQIVSAHGQIKACSRIDEIKTYLVTCACKVCTHLRMCTYVGTFAPNHTR
jgi:hypothetical protein